MEGREGKPLDHVVRLRINLLSISTSTAAGASRNALVRFCEDKSSNKSQILCCKLPLDSSAVAAVSKWRVKQAKKNDLARKKLNRKPTIQWSRYTEVNGKKSIPNNTKSRKKWATNTNAATTGDGACMEIASTASRKRTASPKRTSLPKCNTAASLPFVSDEEVLHQTHELALEVEAIRKRTKKHRVQVSRMKRDVSKCRLAIGVLCKSSPPLEEIEVEAAQMINLRGSSAESFKDFCAYDKALRQLENDASGRGGEDLVNLETLYEVLVKSSKHSEERLKALKDMTEADEMKGEECQDGKHVMEAQVFRSHEAASTTHFMHSLSTGGSSRSCFFYAVLLLVYFILYFYYCFTPGSVRSR